MKTISANGPSLHKGVIYSTSEERRSAIAEATCSYYREWFSPDGTWRGETHSPTTRVVLWGIFSLMRGNSADLALANAILRKLEFRNHLDESNSDDWRGKFDIFVTNHTIQLLAQHGDLLEASVRCKLENWARYALKDFPGDRQSDYQFHGCNDNMPAKATLGLLLGGEYFGDAEAVAHGLWNLRQLRDLLTRRGLLSEYTSPTYTPLTLINLAEIAQAVQHPEARELAAQCVERIWADILGHFHPPTGMMGGPYSRAYQLDSTGHFSTASCLLWMALGDRVALKPLDEISRKPIRLVHHHDNIVTQIGVLSWLASCPADPPDYLLEWLNERRYPFHLQASAERGGRNGGQINSTFYAEEDFAVGTADGDSWSELQTDVYFLQYRRAVPLHGLEDLHTVYCRYLVDGQCPGDGRPDHMLKGNGLLHTVQDCRVALVLGRPSLSLAERELSSLKLSIILPDHLSKVDCIEVKDDNIFIKDGPVYLGLCPLNPTDWGRRDAIRIEHVSNYSQVALYNYEGAPREFSSEELGRTLNGFVAVIGLRSEESWEMFCNRVRMMQILDYFQLGCRTVRCQVGETVLGMSYAVATDRVRYRTIGSKVVSSPDWEADGLPAERLPFLTNPKPNSLELPYSHMNIVWAKDEPWIIASQGKELNGRGQHI